MAGSAMKGGDFTLDNTTAPTIKRVLPLFSLQGKTAIVSGAGAGIGLAVAEGLAEAGANVAIWYNSNKKAVEEAAIIEKEYGVKCAWGPTMKPEWCDWCACANKIYNRQSIPSGCDFL
jgi:sorbose reductase